MKKIILITASIILVIVSVFTACKKETEEDLETAYSVQQNISETDQVYDRLNSDCDEIIKEIEANKFQNMGKTLDTCIHVFVSHQDTTTWPKVITVSFTGNCPTVNGNILQGQIIITQTNWMRVSGSIRTITFNNFYINNYKIEGTKTITNNGLTNGHSSFSVVIANGKVITPAGETIITRAAQRTRTWVEGESTLYLLDDVYEITGTTNGTTRNGYEFTSTILQPLVVALNCRWIKQGTISTVITNGPVVVINFGTGTCDSSATITINGNTRTITLRG